MARENYEFPANSKNNYLPAALIVFIVLLTIFLLWTQGRVWWCQVGDYSLWSGEVWSAHNSQHLFDPYTFTHVLHGVLFYWLTFLFFRKMPVAWRLLIAISIESAWEFIENTDAVINRYREATISLDYFGDSIINSLGDILSFAAGFYFAYKFKAWISLAFFLLVEIILLFWIRDSLVLNIIMLLYPLEAIKKWQMGN